MDYNYWLAMHNIHVHSHLVCSCVDSFIIIYTILYFMEHLSCYNNVIQLHPLTPCVVTEVLIVTIVLVYKYNI